MIIFLNDIIIPKKFKESRPRADKVTKVYNHFMQFGKLDKPIVVNRQLELQDGYIRYLVLKMNAFTHADVVIQDKSVYVWGKHKPTGKEYVWKLPHHIAIQVGNIYPGERLVVATRYGKKVITVTRVTVSSDDPVEGRIRSVRGLAN